MAAGTDSATSISGGPVTSQELPPWRPVLLPPWQLQGYSSVHPAVPPCSCLFLCWLASSLRAWPSGEPARPRHLWDGDPAQTGV